MAHGPKTVRSFRIEERIAKQADTYRHKKGRTFTWMVNRALESFLTSPKSGVATPVPPVRKVIPQGPIDLPTQGRESTGRTKRWTNSRKVALVKAVQCGLFRRQDVLGYYRISAEEFSTWEKQCNED